jgi:phage-related holin
MKTTLALTTWLLNIKFQFLPAADLFLVFIITIALDFVTGIAKAKTQGLLITSSGYRKTIIKLMQYGGAIAISMLLKYVSLRNAEFFESSKYVGWLTTGLLIFIIFIEVTSILENLTELDKKSPFSRFILQPLYKLLTFQIKNNPLAKAAEDAKN